MSESEKKKIRLHNRDKVRRYRERPREKKAAQVVANTPSPLIVKIDFDSRKLKSSRKHISRGLSQAHRTIESLSKEKTKLQRKSWALQKKLQRSRKNARQQRSSSQSCSAKPTSEPRTHVEGPLLKEASVCQCTC